MPTVTPVPSRVTTAYITVAELKRSPIYTQLSKLVPGGSAGDNDAELGQIIMRVSALIDSEVNQNLSATVDSEVGRVAVSEYGELRIHTRATPIIQVLSVAVGTDPNNLIPVSDLSSVVVDPWSITVLAPQIYACPRPGRRLWASWTYVNGYPVTALTEASAVGDTSITVADATGILPGVTQLKVKDGKWFETIAPTAVTGNTLTVAPLMYGHQAGVGVSALPDDVQAAALVLISRLHDNWSLAMGAITMDGTGAKHPGAGPTYALCEPAVMLRPYRRMW
jgi:hypothetical protein